MGRRWRHPVSPFKLGTALLMASVLLILNSTSILAQGPSPEYREFPLIGSRLAVWGAAQLHLMFAAFVLAVPLFVLFIEIIGWRKKEERFDRVAHELARLLPPAYGFTAITGAFLGFFLFTLFPSVMGYMSDIFAPSMWIYPAIMILESATLYFWFYLWDRLQGPKKWIHLLLGVLLNIFGTIVMFIANGWASFMMSPAGIGEAGELLSMWSAIANPTWWPLNLHRLVANVTFGALLCGAYAAYRFLNSRDPQERAYYDWMGYIGNMVALFTLLFLPFLGYYLGYEIYQFSPQMGVTLMGGVLSWLFIIQATVIAALFLGAAYYSWMGLWRIPGSEPYRRWTTLFIVISIVGFAVWATPHTLAASPEEATGGFHPVLSALGLMAPKMVAVTLILMVLYVSYMLYRRAGKAIQGGKGLNQVTWGIVALGTAAIIGLGVHGFFASAAVRIRESIYQIIILIAIIVITFTLDTIRLRGAKVLKAVEWGRVPARSQYVLISLAFIIVWLMGLMGYARSALRLNWHVYLVMEDTSQWAGLPSLGQVATVVTAITLIFFVLLGVSFAISFLSSRGHAEGVPDITPVPLAAAPGPARKAKA